MTAPHENAKLLIGFANGRQVQFRDAHLPTPDSSNWYYLEPDNMEVWPFLLSTCPKDHSNQAPRFDFRLAPRTVTINAVEIEAPVSVEEAEPGSDYFTFSATGEVHHVNYGASEFSKRLLEYGMLWHSRIAAKHGHRAVAAALRGAN